MSIKNNYNYSLQYCSMATWKSTKGNRIPANAFRAGYEADGRPLFIARARMVDGVMTPGKCGCHLHGAHIAYGGKELIIDHYEVMVLPPGANGFYEFKPDCRDGNVPPNAVEIDRAIYVGRYMYEHCGSLIPGKVATQHACIYVGFGGQEFNSKVYETLVQIK